MRALRQVRNHSAFRHSLRSGHAPPPPTSDSVPEHLDDGIGQVWGSVRDPLPSEPRPSRLFRELGPGESRYNRYDAASGEQAARWLHERGATVMLSLPLEAEKGRSRRPAGIPGD